MREQSGFSPAGPIPAGLSRSSLHDALQDPVLESISFLNEIMDRYPQSISFAPGAPNAGLFEHLDLNAYLERYTAYLREQRGMTRAQVAKHLYQYGPSQGQINALLAQALRMDERIDVADDAIVVTVGCQEALLLILRALCTGPDSLLAVVDPCFAGIAGAARVLDVPMVAINETSDGIDFDQLEQACRAARAAGRRVRALYVAPDYSNPSGTILSLNARERLLALAERADFLVLEDNAYGFTATPEAALPTLKSLDRATRVIYLGTCAKICLPGVRVGFAVADQIVTDAQGRTRLLAQELAALKSMVTVNTSPICQAIVGGMLLEHGGSMRALANDKGALYRRNLGHLLDALDRHLPPEAAQRLNVSWNRPAGGFFVRMRLPVRADAALLDDCARRYGVLWTPMSFFHLGHAGDHELRLSCSYLTPQQIDEGVARLARFLHDPRVTGHAA
jgi:(S)-3,5-dihydroxyphenylglycine transaminase